MNKPTKVMLLLAGIILFVSLSVSRRAVQPKATAAQPMRGPAALGPSVTVCVGQSPVVVKRTVRCEVLHIGMAEEDVQKLFQDYAAPSRDTVNTLSDGTTLAYRVYHASAIDFHKYAILLFRNGKLDTVSQ